MDNIVQEEKNIFHLGIITGLFLHISGALMAVYVLKEIAKSGIVKKSVVVKTH